MEEEDRVEADLRKMQELNGNKGKG